MFSTNTCICIPPSLPVDPGASATLFLPTPPLVPREASSSGARLGPWQGVDLACFPGGSSSLSFIHSRSPSVTEDAFLEHLPEVGCAGASQGCRAVQADASAACALLEWSSRMHRTRVMTAREVPCLLRGCPRGLSGAPVTEEEFYRRTWRHEKVSCARPVWLSG